MIIDLHEGWSPPKTSLLMIPVKEWWNFDHLQHSKLVLLVNLSETCGQKWVKHPHDWHICIDIHIIYNNSTNKNNNTNPYNNNNNNWYIIYIYSYTYQNYSPAPNDIMFNTYFSQSSREQLPVANTQPSNSFPKRWKFWAFFVHLLERMTRGQWGPPSH